LEPQSSCNANTPDGPIDLIPIRSRFIIGPLLSLSIGMVPEDYPIFVPAGGEFNYNGYLRNNSDMGQVVDVWIMLNVPDHGMYGPIMRMNNIPVAPGQTLFTEDIVQHIPSYAPLANYDYISLCGDYPFAVVDGFSFPFEVIPDTFATSGGDWSIAEWFDDKTVSDNGVKSGESSETISNFPNPFNASTEIKFNLKADGETHLDVYDIAGRKISTLISGYLHAGEHSISFDGSHLASGIYYYRLITGDKTITNKMVLLK